MSIASNLNLSLLALNPLFATTCRWQWPRPKLVKDNGLSTRHPVISRRSPLRPVLRDSLIDRHLRSKLNPFLGLGVVSSGRNDHPKSNSMKTIVEWLSKCMILLNTTLRSRSQNFGCLYDRRMRGSWIQLSQMDEALHQLNNHFQAQ